MGKTFIEILEQQELIDKLVSYGHGQLVEVLLMEDSYTKKDRLNKSSACRKLGWKPKQLEDALREWRYILCKELDFDEEL